LQRVPRTHRAPGLSWRHTRGSGRNTGIQNLQKLADSLVRRAPATSEAPLPDAARISQRKCQKNRHPKVPNLLISLEFVGGVDGARTRDPRRDRAGDNSSKIKGLRAVRIPKWAQNSARLPRRRLGVFQLSAGSIACASIARRRSAERSKARSGAGPMLAWAYLPVRGRVHASSAARSELHVRRCTLRRSARSAGLRRTSL
jgi:hypothetical protein